MTGANCAAALPRRFRSERKPIPLGSHGCISLRTTLTLASLMATGSSKHTGSPPKYIDLAKANAQRPVSDGGSTQEVQHVSKIVAGSLVDFTLILSLLFGGCCSNVWSYEYILKMDPHLGTALTFSQMCFITLHSLPSFLQWDRSCIPRLQRRHVPIRQWIAQVLVLTSSSLLNNWAFAFHVPLTVQIVFRSAGLAVSMLFGFLFFKRRYSLPQIASVVIVSMGVLLATLSKPSSSTKLDTDDPRASMRYALGVLMMTTSLFLTGALGLLQERTYSMYGPYWKEGVFYTHLLSIPIFVFLAPDVKNGFDSFCQQLTSRVTSVSTNLVLTARKAISLCISVWWFGNGWNAELTTGAGMVFAGSLLYTWYTSEGEHEDEERLDLSDLKPPTTPTCHSA
ncbi:UAA transporter family-domain-containing protein [Fomitopsis serialis]|uniref:UAA transporter family-domain-containing protein n=1 Tax=Fomitopsis serialis TaxID=139415 RepID=UPI0020079DEF|nr:UAA transporter family-domain-containing protein [Neoantrodia serialis]KAH9933345.1 UAA transporter family-domain-containing protein [Neoantrodia serialis]